MREMQEKRRMPGKMQTESGLYPAHEETKQKNKKGAITQNGGMRMLRFGREGQRLETQKNQKNAGVKLHPRKLARSIAKAKGAKKEWRQVVAALPRTGEKYLHPERHR